MKMLKLSICGRHQIALLLLAAIALTCLGLADVMAMTQSPPATSPADLNQAVSESDEESKSKPNPTPGNADKKLPEVISFNAHIRPIMSNTCFTCHGPDEEANESSLRLDSFAAAVDQGGAIEPGDPETSLVYERLTSEDEPMPPADFLHQLSDYEIGLFKRWIEQGAKYQSHWSYTPLKRPNVPEVSPDQTGNEIDAFILARLQLEGLTSTASADKATLLRRLSLDLIGLPPSPVEIQKFMDDTSPDAYQKQVDRLLASPHYGERMAPQWLDLVHFADTVGFHGDQNQHLFAYRDYVINSLNQNKPFDEFTQEQLAGDLLENPTDEQLIATALIRLNMMTREGGAQPAEYIAKYTADRVRMLGTAWMGLTTGCCECHNHKYDPLTAKDFYSLGAFFDDIRQWGVYTTYGYTPNPDLAGYNNDYPFPPELRSASSSLKTQIQHLEAAAAEAINQSTDADKTLQSAAFRKWAGALAVEVTHNADGWTPISVTDVGVVGSKKGSGKAESKTIIKILDDKSVLISGPPSKETFQISGSLSRPLSIKSIRLEVLPDESNQGFVGRSKNGKFTTGFAVGINAAPSIPKPEKAEHEKTAELKVLKVEYAQADRLTANRYRSGSPDRFLFGKWQSGPARWQLPTDEATLKHTAVYHLRNAAEILDGDKISVALDSENIGRVRISVSPLTRFVAGMDATDPRLLDALEAYGSDKPLTPVQQQTLLAAYYWSSTSADKISQDLKLFRDEIADCDSGWAMSTVTQRTDPQKWRHSRILPRGNWQDKSGEEVLPATPGFLPPLPAASDRPLTRLDLADWLTSDTNPLTSRHYVNRTWKHFFGAGLSNQLDDLGNQGEWPSHPLLLDWLADEFRQTWDMKQFARLIVTSKTYQRSVSHSSQAIEIDPYNRLLAGQSPRRLEAEIVRDNALAISGLLSDDYVGGPSVYPYQPAGYYGNIQFPNRTYRASNLFLQYRRGVYMHWQRTFLHPMLVNFDAPSRDECTADRTPSNSPQQALTLLNDPEFVEASNAFATSLLTEHPDSDFLQRLNSVFNRALARDANSMELEGLKSFFDLQKTYYSENKEEIQKLLNQNGNFKPSTDLDPLEVAAWSQVCRVVLNLHETITRY